MFRLLLLFENKCMEMVEVYYSFMCKCMDMSGTKQILYFTNVETRVILITGEGWAPLCGDSGLEWKSIHNKTLKNYNNILLLIYNMLCHCHFTGWLFQQISAHVKNKF